MDDKKSLDKYIIEALRTNDIKHSVCVELMLKAINKSSAPCNPGVLGAGLLTANLSDQSNNMILNYTKLLVDIYKGSKYNGIDGSLLREVICK